MRHWLASWQRQRTCPEVRLTSDHFRRLFVHARLCERCVRSGCGQRRDCGGADSGAIRSVIVLCDRAIDERQIGVLSDLRFRPFPGSRKRVATDSLVQAGDSQAGDILPASINKRQQMLAAGNSAPDLEEILLASSSSTATANDPSRWWRRDCSRAHKLVLFMSVRAAAARILRLRRGAPCLRRSGTSNAGKFRR